MGGTISIKNLTANDLQGPTGADGTASAAGNDDVQINRSSNLSGVENLVWLLMAVFCKRWQTLKLVKPASLSRPMLAALMFTSMKLTISS